MKKMRDRRTVSESEGAAYWQGGSDASLEMFRGGYTGESYRQC